MSDKDTKPKPRPGKPVDLVNDYGGKGVRTPPSGDVCEQARDALRELHGGGEW